MSEQNYPDPSKRKPFARLRVVNESPHGHRAKVFLNDIDVSRGLHQLTLDVSAGDLTRATLGIYVESVDVDVLAEVVRDDPTSFEEAPDGQAWTGSEADEPARPARRPQGPDQHQ